MDRQAIVGVTLAAALFLVLTLAASQVGPKQTVLSTSIANSIANDVDSALDSAILGKTRESAELSRKEPNIVTALDLTTQPHYARQIDEWAQERRIRELKDTLPHPSKNIAALRNEEAALKKKLDSMLKHGVHSTTAKVNHVLKTEAKIARQNKAEIHNELTSDFINPKAPSFHSVALDKPVRVHTNAREQEIQYLQNKLARKVAAGERLVRENTRLKLLASKKAAHTAALAAARVSSLATTDSAPAASSSSSTQDDGPVNYAWDSPPGEYPVPYKGFRDDAVPAARDTLKTSRDRVTARLEAQLRNSKERLERFRSHWSVYMPEDLRRATDAGWTSRYAKDYMNQGKTRSDLSSEEEIIRDLKSDLDDKYSQEEKAAQELRDIKTKENELAIRVGDLSQKVEKDQRDLSIAQNNAEALRHHLPEYYDDLSDDDYRSLYRHVRPFPKAQDDNGDHANDNEEQQQEPQQ